LSFCAVRALEATFRAATAAAVLVLIPAFTRTTAQHLQEQNRVQFLPTRGFA
jgi:hypothetical protein